ncbi:MAG: DUF308 domain-containing protein [Actinomycetota bacterium]
MQTTEQVQPATRAEFRQVMAEAADRWWLFLVTGIAWVIFAFLVFQFDIASVSAIAIFTGVAFIAAGFNEFLMIPMVSGWKWLHAVMGVIFIGAGILALAWPDTTFFILASIIGWFFAFKGIFDIILAIGTRKDFELWWLRLISGVIELLIGLWAVSYPGRSMVLLILWVGISALMRGITEIIFAFELHGAGKELRSDTTGAV